VRAHSSASCRAVHRASCADSVQHDSHRSRRRRTTLPLASTDPRSVGRAGRIERRLRRPREHRPPRTASSSASGRRSRSARAAPGLRRAKRTRRLRTHRRRRPSIHTLGRPNPTPSGTTPAWWPAVPGRAVTGSGRPSATTIQLTPHRPVLPRCWELRENVTVYYAADMALAKLPCRDRTSSEPPAPARCRRPSRGRGRSAACL
jgi:hypothetical protein